MELFAHNGVEHATTAEAASHIITTNALSIILIVLSITVIAIGMQRVLRKTSKVSIRTINRRQ